MQANLFLRVTVSVWTLGYIVPAHTKQVFEKYGVTLGVNTMQGREANHQQLAQYAKNTTFKNMWHQIFRHKYICIYDYCKTNYKYVPIYCDTNDICHCGLAKSIMSAKCNICITVIMRDVSLSVKNRKVCASLKSSTRDNY